MLNTIDTEFHEPNTMGAKKFLKDIQYCMVFKDGVFSFWEYLADTDQVTQLEISRPYTSIYVTLKNISHIVAYIFKLVLVAETVADLPASFALLSQQLNEIDITSLKFEPELQNHCVAIVKQSHILINVHYDNKADIELALENHKKAIDASLENCMLVARSEQENHLRKVFLELYINYIKDPKTLKKTRFVFVGPHAPRDDLIEINIMKKLFSSYIENSAIIDNYIFYLEERVYLSEQLDIEKDIIRGFLADAAYAAKLSKFMYGNAQVLEADLLSQCPHLAKD